MAREQSLQAVVAALVEQQPNSWCHLRKGDRKKRVKHCCSKIVCARPPPADCKAKRCQVAFHSREITVIELVWLNAPAEEIHW